MSKLKWFEAGQKNEPYATERNSTGKDFITVDFVHPDESSTRDGCLYFP